MDESSVFGMILHVLIEVVFQGLGRWFVDFLWVDEDALIRKLKTTILSIEAMLNCTTQKNIANAAVQEWLKELEDAVCDARILLNEVCADSPHGKLRSRARTKEINRALDKLQYMAGQKDVLGLRELEISPLCKSPTSSFLQESHVYGRDDDVEAITRLLLSYDASSDITSVIAIVGDAGIGKTTLAQLVINDKRIQEQYHRRVWVCVSNGFDAYSMSKTILEAVTMSTCDIRELNALQIRLGEELSNKKLLLVLDDVKDENCTEWEILKGPLRYCSRESKIIVTTCDENIAAMMRTLPAYHLSRLSFKDCWCIFARYAFHGGRFVADPELKEVGRGIVMKCKGHPLAAKTIGNLLRYQSNREEWDGILKDEIWDSSHDIISITQNLILKSRRNRWKESIEQNNREKYASMNLNMKRLHSGANIHDKLMSVPPMYKAIRPKKAWFPKLLILWIIVWSALSLAVFNVTNNHLKIEREKLHERMCIQEVSALENQLKIYSDHMFRLAIPMLQLSSYQNAFGVVKTNKTVSSYIDSFWVAWEGSEESAGKKCVCSCPKRDHLPLHLSPLQSISEKGQANFSKAAVLGKPQFFGVANLASMSSMVVYPVHTSALAAKGSSSSQESMRSVVGFIGWELNIQRFAEGICGFNHPDESRRIWLNVRFILNTDNYRARGEQHCENDEPILHRHNFTLKEQGWGTEITCGHYKKVPLTWTSITITMLLLLNGVLLGYTIYIIADSIIITGEASSTIQELHAHIDTVDAATAQQLSTASHKIITHAQSIQETLALQLSSELSPTQRGYAKLAHTSIRNLITTAKQVLKRSH